MRGTINQLLDTVNAQAGERARSDAFAILIKQLQEANQHLVLAAFGAQDLQATAEAANLRQTEFLSMLAHELRNPLQPMAMANEPAGRADRAAPELPRCTPSTRARSTTWPAWSTTCSTLRASAAARSPCSWRRFC